MSTTVSGTRPTRGPHRGTRPAPPQAGQGPPQGPARSERGALAQVRDPRTCDDVLTLTLERFPTSAVLGALLARRPAHPELVAAMHGRRTYDALHYAVLDGTAATLDAALDHMSDPRTWDVLGPAIAGAPAATHAHLARLLTLLGDAGDDSADIRTEVNARLLDD